MINYKILIIDDDYQSRKNVYNDFFSANIEDNSAPHFELVYLQSPKKMEEQIKKSNADAILIDAFLNDELKPIWKDTNISSVLGIIKIAYEKIPPIFLVSSKWNSDLLGNVNDAFAELLPNVLPKKYYTFSFMNTLIQESNEKDLSGNLRVKDLVDERSKIQKIIAEHYGRTNKKLFTKGKINILHISDLQYGDPKTTKNNVGLFRTMVQLIKNSPVKNIDLVVISGDIAMSGKENEYKDAMELITLFQELWPEEKDNSFAERIIFAPGNHDFDINFCMLNYFNAKNMDETREVDILSIIRELVNNTIKDQDNLQYNKFGISAFKNYCYEISGNDIYVQDNNFNLLINNFLDWGVRFIVLNSVSSIDAKQTNKACFDKNAVNDLLSKLDNEKHGDKIFNIVVSHHTELFFDEVDNSEDERAVLNQLKNAIKCKLFLGGHRHKNDKKDSKTTIDEKYSVIEAPSLRVDEKDEDYLRGFNIIQLDVSEDETIKSLTEYQCGFNNDGAVEIKHTFNHSFK